MNTQKNIKNKRFGRLIVVSKSDVKRRGRGQWNCICDCGNELLVVYTYLMNGTTKSCGCINTERITKHGKSRSRLYVIWVSMKSRCLNPNNKSYYRYGGRGITICDRWLDFTLFYEDVISTYQKGLSLDRHPNNNGNYGPDNFRWATNSEQSRNMRTNRVLQINGESKPVVEWAEIFGLTSTCIYTRLYRGFSDHESIFGKPKK